MMVWNSLRLSGTLIWDSLGLLETLLDSLELSGTVCNCLGVSGTLCDSPGLSEALWDSHMGLSGSLWDCLGLSGTNRPMSNVWGYLVNWAKKDCSKLCKFILFWLILTPAIRFGCDEQRRN